MEYNKLKTTHLLLAVTLIFLAGSDNHSFADGQSDFEASCTACHGFGIAGAPKVGDKENWAPRIERGMATLYSNAINGFSGNSGYMPAKGGFSNLSDEQIEAIVDYMVEQSR